MSYLTFACKKTSKGAVRKDPSPSRRTYIFTSIPKCFLSESAKEDEDENENGGGGGGKGGGPFCLVTLPPSRQPTPAAERAVCAGEQIKRSVSLQLVNTLTFPQVS